MLLKRAICPDKNPPKPRETKKTPMTVPTTGGLAKDVTAARPVGDNKSSAKEMVRKAHTMGQGDISWWDPR